MENSTPNKEELDERIVKLKSLHDVGDEILKSTIQFFFDNAKPNQHAAGSGILLNIAEKYFIVTAAHVFSEQSEKLYVIASEEAISLGGMLYTTPIPKFGSRLDDKIDLAIIEIEGDIATKIKTEYKFIELNDILLGHGMDPDSRYLAIGYPLTKTKKIWGKNELKAKPFAAVLKVAENFHYKKFKFSFNSHIAIEFNSEIVSENNLKTHLSPSLEGISGGGLWYLPDFLEKDSNYTKKLIGITIELVNGPTNKVIVATRIDLVTEFLRQHLLLDIPHSKKISINIK